MIFTENVTLIETVTVTVNVPTVALMTAIVTTAETASLTEIETESKIVIGIGNVIENTGPAVAVAAHPVAVTEDLFFPLFDLFFFFF
mmetsp:Transcript_53362/g.88653  ORF Transcript_53362/g.88653 Transcript_53362/m.88653 type:complete len:87 (-) Transcript_53362:23-283(-)